MCTCMCTCASLTAYVALSDPSECGAVQKSLLAEHKVSFAELGPSILGPGLDVWMLLVGLWRVSGGCVNAYKLMCMSMYVYISICIHLFICIQYVSVTVCVCVCACVCV